VRVCVCVCCVMCGYGCVYVWVCVCTGFLIVGGCMCGFYNVWMF
jgi:hypothetical protein